MLSVLHIENIAVIEQAEILFEGGFNVLTGETGAGKSIVIDAISAILGERTYRDVIRTGANRAFVSAIFTNIPQYDWFSENQVEFDPQELQVQREIYADGRNVCRVNGRPVSVASLKKLGGRLINIHGQHDSQQLFDEENHLTYLDAFARDEQEFEAYQQAFSAMQSVQREIQKLSMDESEKLRLVETLTFQIEEIRAANLVSGEEEQLKERRKVLQNAEKLSDALRMADEALYGGDSSDGAAGLLSNAEHALSRVSTISADMQTLHQKISDLMYSVQDAADELEDAFKMPGRVAPDKVASLNGIFHHAYLDSKMKAFTDSIAKSQEGIMDIEEFLNEDDLDMHVHKRLLKWRRIFLPVLVSWVPS